MTVETMTLTDFLLERIAEDERHARKLAEADRRPVLALAVTVNHPERLLLECEAKRRLIAVVGPRENMGHPQDVSVDYYRDGLVSMRDSNLRHLAAIYADHPDYLPEWRP